MNGTQVEADSSSDGAMRWPHVHEAYRAASVGLQAAAAAVALQRVLRFVGLISSTCSCVTFTLVALLSALVALRVNEWRLRAMGRGVLVTGCDSGFGLALAQRLQKLGCTVFAGCLNDHSDGAKKLRDLPRVHVLQLDVTDDKQVEAARVYVEEHPTLNGLWGVVNNAGIFLSGPLEWARPQDALLMFNVNTLGQLRVSKAFLPLLRRTRGRLVNVASLTGRMPVDCSGIYSMSTHASQSLAEQLRLEQRRFGVHVAVVEPGDFFTATRIMHADELKASLASSWKSLSPEARDVYGEGYLGELQKGLRKEQGYSSSQSRDISPVVEALEHALLGQWPAARYAPADLSHTLRAWLSTHGPEWLYDAIYA